MLESTYMWVRHSTILQEFGICP